MEKRIKVLVVEQESGYRAALEGVISTADDMECVGAYSTAREGLEALSITRPDVLLLGVSGKDGGGGKVVRQIARRFPAVGVVVLDSTQDSQTILDCLSAGALGYLLRSNSWSTICEGIRQIRKGGSPFSPSVAHEVVRLVRSMTTLQPSESLSGREKQVVRLLGQKTRNKEIAVALNLSVPTVRTHLRAIYLKLRIRSRAEAFQRLRQFSKERLPISL
jgi:DNA-binding NarL/FixJ family response regulator